MVEEDNTYHYFVCKLNDHYVISTSYVDAYDTFKENYPALDIRISDIEKMELVENDSSDTCHCVKIGAPVCYSCGRGCL